ncbi:MAG: PaaI family thioesterase, partial [Hyphomicrobiaceae bacterium]
MSRSNAPANPRFESTVRESFARQGMMKLLGAALTEVSPGRVMIEVPFSDRISQQQGLFHGAVIGAIADNAAGYASLSLMPVDSEVVTVEYKINFLRPADGDLLRAIGEVVRAGRNMT